MGNYDPQTKFHKEKMTNFGIRFHNENDKDVIERLRTVPNKTDYIRQLVRADLNKSKEN